MKPEVKEAIERGIKKRAKVLQELTLDQKTQLLELLFSDFFNEQHAVLQKWAALTGQTAQVDTGYIAQFVASIVTGIPGQGFRGKGDDLVDGSEVKSAANLSGVDRPRWNHNLGTATDDAKRIDKGEKTLSQRYLESPLIFYLLVDRPADHDEEVPPIRIRAWCLDAKRDTAWRDLVEKYQSEKTGSKYNFQLHPPVGFEDSLVVNTLGNLDFKDVLLFDYRMQLSSTGKSEGKWVKPLEEFHQPITGRTKAEEYRKNARHSNYTEASDLVADIAVLPDRFPGIILKKTEDVVDLVAADELNT